MVRLISRQRGSLAALKLTKLFGINDFPAAKDSRKVLIIIIYCYLIIITITMIKMIIIAVVTMRTFALGKIDLMTISPRET